MSVTSPTFLIESLDSQGRGVAHADGKAVFVDGALPGERVVASIFSKRPTFDQANLLSVHKPNASRNAPRCAHYGVCGGCAMQHLDAAAQVAAKQRVLEDALLRIAKRRPESMLAAVHGESWGYRHRARFSVRRVVKKGTVLVGFHEKRSNFIADMTACAVVPERISRLLPLLRTLIDSLEIRDRIPQLEMALAADVDAFVIRHLSPLGEADKQRLRLFAETHGIAWFLQPAGPATAWAFYPEHTALSYALPEFGVKLGFGPTEFTQVNTAVNRVLVRRAMMLLDPWPGERIADLFCGLGNFSIPIASKGAAVVGFEGERALVQRATENAAQNGLANHAAFHQADLFRNLDQVAQHGPYDKVLIDPPRDGALEIVKHLVQAPPRRIVYVSCHPATLARDAGVLCDLGGYRFRAAGVVNMFPHTAHVESIALFERA